MRNIAVTKEEEDLATILLVSHIRKTHLMREEIATDLILKEALRRKKAIE